MEVPLDKLKMTLEMPLKYPGKNSWDNAGHPELFFWIFEIFSFLAFFRPIWLILAQNLKKWDFWPKIGQK